MKALITLGKTLLALGIVLYLIYLLANNWTSLSFRGLVFEWSWVPSFLLFSISTLLGGVLWKNLLQTISKTNTLSLPVALHLHSIAWLYRYVPGKVANVAYKISAPQKFGFSGKETSAAFLYETIFSTVASLLLAVPVLVLFGLSDVGVFWSVAGSVGIVTVLIGFLWLINQPFTHKKNFGLEKLFGPTKGLAALPWRQALGGVSLHLFPRLSMALGCSVLVIAEAESDWVKVYVAGAVFLFATVVGLTVPFAPSGLGVREGVIIAMLAPVLGFTEAVALSVLTRVLTVSSDLFVFLITSSVVGLGRRR